MNSLLTDKKLPNGCTVLAVRPIHLTLHIPRRIIYLSKYRNLEFEGKKKMFSQKQVPIPLVENYSFISLGQP